MTYFTDGSRYQGGLFNGQVWVKNGVMRRIVRFDEHVMVYQSKTDMWKGTETTVARSVFRRWLTSGERARVDRWASVEGVLQITMNQEMTELFDTLIAQSPKGGLEWE